MADAAPVAIDWRIEPGRVGPLEVGKPMPEALLVPGLEAHYIARYIADAQPVDGFRYDEPPLTVLILAGPFATHVDQVGETVEPPVDQLRGEGAEAARGGARVTTIVIHGKGPATAAGLGVGSTFDELRAAYADVRLVPRPETLGDDTCMARTGSLPGVGFVFTTCDKARRGEPVTRVDLWLPD